jgi:hypothetical protein
MTRTQPEPVDPKGPGEVKAIQTANELRESLPTSAPSAGRGVVFDPREGFYPRSLLESAAFVSAPSVAGPRGTLNSRKVALIGLVLIAVALGGYVFWSGRARLSEPAIPRAVPQVATPADIPAQIAPAPSVPPVDRAAATVPAPAAPAGGERVVPTAAVRPAAPRSDHPLAVVPVAAAPAAPPPAPQGAPVTAAPASQPTITHTKAAGVAPYAPIPVPVAAPAPARRTETRTTVAPALPAGPCTEAIAALGLCDAPPKREGK